MKNFVFISPNFPSGQWRFCQELRKNGLRVLGIGDAPYDSLSSQVRDNLHEYYRVDTLEDFDTVYRAVAYFIHRYGRIDWLESNNEYWLERDAALRTAYQIPTGLQLADMPRTTSRLQMKEYYQKAGLLVPRSRLADDAKQCIAFAEQVGYPVVVKPDDGKSLQRSRKLMNAEELKRFLEEKDPQTAYLMEEFIRAEIHAYDAIVDGDGNPLFEVCRIDPLPLLDMQQCGDAGLGYVMAQIPDDLRKAGRSAVKAFGVRNRFVHFEFFRLNANHPGLGKKGQLVAQEVHVRPAGGYALDMMNYAASTDVFKLWADMIAFGSVQPVAQSSSYCARVVRRHDKRYLLSHERLMTKYADQLKLVSDNEADQARTYIAAFPTKQAMDAFLTDVLWCEMTA